MAKLSGLDFYKPFPNTADSPSAAARTYAAPRLLSPSVGGMNMTVTILEPHRGQRRRLATIDSGKSLPRVATDASMPRSSRQVHRLQWRLFDRVSFRDCRHPAPRNRKPRSSRHWQIEDGGLERLLPVSAAFPALAACACSSRTCPAEVQSQGGLFL